MICVGDFSSFFHDLNVHVFFAIFSRVFFFLSYSFLPFSFIVFFILVNFLHDLTVHFSIFFAF